MFPTPIALLNSIFLDPMTHLPSLYGSYYEYLNFNMSQSECCMSPLHRTDIRTLSGTPAPLPFFRLIQPTPWVRCLDPSFCYSTLQSTSQQIQPSLTSRIIQLLLTSKPLLSLSRSIVMASHWLACISAVHPLQGSLNYLLQ